VTNYARETWLEEYNYVPYAQRHPAPTAPPSAFRPQGYCPRCGGSVWVDRGENQWGCASCGLDPSRPTQEKHV